ncbi:dicarboxylate/amino acid:cation symporter [Fusobacterium varium]|uniref:Sodium:proton antiporter n=16 Tax=Fusobacteriaceae TaxID=203492 RepID=A0ABM6U7K6_FUSVA|nr:dicarboxylate/amino acid:cation symporter [Fusobacterium varium]AVQ32377.1 sodium:proton antiporter [Fusobacterium varium ATCC 27725]UYI77902.1 MAG: dicarboxylate/amino acid:cation symporter [Fusobacterium varium]VEH38685.1 Na(+)/serine-threonine symporter [Fusobacterium varium]
MKKIGLLPKLIIGLIAGIVVGKIGYVPLLRIMLTFNGVFGNFLQFVIPLIILGFVAPGIGDLGKKAGKLLAVTTVLAYGSTIVSGSLAFFTNSILLKKILPAGAALAEGSHPEAGLLSGYLTVDMPPIMGVMTALLMAFIIGIGIAVVEGTTLKNFMNEIQTIVEKIITNIIIPFLPLYIAGIFANMTYAGEIIKIMSVFAKVFGIIIILHFVILLVQYTIAGTLAGANPLLLIRKMLPAYFTAIGTQSSAATIPVTLNQTKENGVNEGIADFTIPLCATIHLSGSTITLVSCSMAVMMLHGMPITFSGMFGFILMLGVTMVAAPGVPGGAVMAALGLLESMLGFGPELTSLMIALYLTQDSFGTACNVTGDGAIAIMVNKIAGFKLIPLKKENRIKVS